MRAQLLISFVIAIHCSPNIYIFLTYFRSFSSRLWKYRNIHRVDNCIFQLKVDDENNNKDNLQRTKIIIIIIYKEPK